MDFKKAINQSKILPKAIKKKLLKLMPKFDQNSRVKMLALLTRAETGRLEIAQEAQKKKDIIYSKCIENLKELGTSGLRKMLKNYESSVRLKEKNDAEDLLNNLNN